MLYMDKPRFYICQSYFLHPQFCKSWFLRIESRKPGSEQGVLLGDANNAKKDCKYYIWLNESLMISIFFQNMLDSN